MRSACLGRFRQQQRNSGCTGEIPGSTWTALLVGWIQKHRVKCGVSITGSLRNQGNPCQGCQRHLCCTGDVIRAAWPSGDSRRDPGAGAASRQDRDAAGREEHRALPLLLSEPRATNGKKWSYGRRFVGRKTENIHGLSPASSLQRMRVRGASSSWALWRLQPRAEPSLLSWPLSGTAH